MDRYSLILENLTLPPPRGRWPESLELRLGMTEVLLIEGVGEEDSQNLLDVAATLAEPEQGQVRLWGKDVANLSRPDLYDLRRQIAYVHPKQALIQIYTLAENIALGPSYHFGTALSDTFRKHASLIDRLELQPFLSLKPPEVSESVYLRTLWARQLVKDPELILAIMEISPDVADAQDLLLTLLPEYLQEQKPAVILVGHSLAAFYHLAHRVIKLTPGHLQERPLREPSPRPLIDCLPLI
jgi:glycine betaine/proline transport system ATP-binding protein